MTLPLHPWLLLLFGFVFRVCVSDGSDAKGEPIFLNRDVSSDAILPSPSPPTLLHHIFGLLALQINIITASI